MSLTTLQNIILPNLDISATEESYVRCFGGAHCKPQERSVLMPKGSCVSMDTFYNSFDLGFWKKYTQVNDLLLKLDGTGHAKVTFSIANIGSTPIEVGKLDLNLADSEDIPIKSFGNHNSGKLYIVVEALTDCVLLKGCFFTTSEATQEVKLGIVITHYNRKQFVVPAIERIEKELTNQSWYANKVRLVIVDNSQNILPSEVRNSVLLKNQNSGGSGGFARGLLYLKDNGYTHCLFADDDGSYEIDCVKRTYVFYSYLKDEYRDMTLTGVSLSINRPSIIIEKGVLTNGDSTIYRNKTDLDIDDFNNVLISDDEFNQVNYSNWCFFCFPIDWVKKWPFPFFVRGDDVLFSLQNQFRIASVCGIACYIEDFAFKDSPLIKYLSYRSWYVSRITNFWHSRWEAIRLFSKLYFLSLLTYQFDSAQAILIAHNDMLEGGSIFVDDICLNKIKEKIGNITVIEKPAEMDCSTFSRECISNESLFRKLIRFGSLQGLLIPGFMFKDETIFIDQGSKGREKIKHIFLYKKVFYSFNGKGYITTHDKKKLFAGFTLWAKGVLGILTKFDSSKRALNRLADELTTEQFWRKVQNSLN